MHIQHEELIYKDKNLKASVFHFYKKIPILLSTGWAESISDSLTAGPDELTLSKWNIKRAKSVEEGKITVNFVKCMH